MFEKKNPLFIDPKVVYPIQDPNLSFDDYANKCRDIIKKNRCDLHTPIAESIIQANSPFELKPEKEFKYGAVMLHGLFDSPFVMRDVGEHLQKQNLLVRAHLLPGHGTVPGGLLSVRYQDWLDASSYAINNLSKDVEKIFLVGFSTGATLLLYQTLVQKYKNIAGLILLAPAIKLYTTIGFASGWPRFIDWIWTRAQWLRIAPENDYAKYQSFTFNSGYQIYLLTKQLRKISQNNKLNVPALVVISENDMTVLSKATLEYFEKQTTSDSELLIYTNSPDKINDKRLIARRATFEDWNIHNISHIAIPIAPNNPHYGMHGDYEYASHILENMKSNKKISYDTFDEFHNDRQRITFNPDFEFLKQTITKFVTKQMASV